jgi:SNF2 family DNA or RNA helicase
LSVNPSGKFLIFSRYDNTFSNIFGAIEERGIKVKQLKGSMDSVAATLRQFDAGKIQCLLLNSRYAGSGLNITSASHVVLMHSMTHEEEKQILGRAYRSGRSDPLHVYKLLYQNELTNLE